MFMSFSIYTYQMIAFLLSFLFFLSIFILLPSICLLSIHLFFFPLFSSSIHLLPTFYPPSSFFFPSHVLSSFPLSFLHSIFLLSILFFLHSSIFFLSCEDTWNCIRLESMTLSSRLLIEAFRFEMVYCICSHIFLVSSPSLILFLSMLPVDFHSSVEI